MEKQVRDQESKAMKEKRKQQGLADFEEQKDNNGLVDGKGVKEGDEHAEPLAPFRRSGEPGSRK